MEAGYSRKDFDLKPPFPLAGLVTARDRLADRIRDPLGVTVVVFKEQGVQTALISADILVVTPELFDAVKGFCTGLGLDGVYMSATHTHSGPGGWAARKGARAFMGRFDPKLFDVIFQTVQSAVREALDALSPVESILAGTSQVPGLTMNRRVKHGPVDDRVSIVELRRKHAQDIVIWSASGHPVATAFIQPHTASADVPGMVNAALGSGQVLPLCVPGAMGGLNLLFPEEPPDLENHLKLVSTLILSGVSNARENAASGSGYGFTTVPLKLNRRPSPIVGWPPVQAVQSLLWASVGSLFRLSVADPKTELEIPALRIGTAIFVGMPADFGVGPTLKARQDAAGQDSPLLVVSSHTNGFIGYVHLSNELSWNPDVRPGVFHYENAMGWYGPDVGDRLVAATRSAVKSLW